MADFTSVTRERFQTVCAFTFAALLCAATVARFARNGPPYLEKPRTVMDHVARTQHETRDVLLVLAEVKERIPAGAQVTVFRPQNGGPHNDQPSFLTAVGILNDHFVLPPFVAGREVAPTDLVEFVVAVGTPLDHPHYELVEQFETGYLYRVRR